jgi:hypothetical protein
MKPSQRIKTRFRRREDDGLTIYEPDRVLEQLWRVDWKREQLPYCGVYVISTDSLFPCKIGVSVNPAKRLASLQTSHWRGLQISEYRWCETVADATRVEREAHKILRAHDKALLGEWFDVRPSEAVEAMEWAALTVGATLRSDIPTPGLEERLRRIASDIDRAEHIASGERMAERRIFHSRDD